MHKKFAKINFIQNIEQVPLKYKILKIAPVSVIDWYINKFNPFIMEEITLADEQGYSIKVPIIEAEVMHKEEQTQDLIRRTLEALKDYDVEIVLPPKEYPYPFPDIIQISDGKNLFPFFLYQVVLKAFKIFNKELKTAEFLIIDESGNHQMTLNVIDNIYREVNYLSVMVKDLEDFDYSKKAQDIFSDTGLNLNVTKKNKTLLQDADVIINISSEAERFEFYFKRGAMYFDLGNNLIKTKELLYKRDDMFIVDDIRVNYNGENFPLHIFEMVFYQKSKAYRTMSFKGYNEYFGDAIRETIKELDIYINGFFAKDIFLNSTHYTSIIEKSGR